MEALCCGTQTLVVRCVVVELWRIPPFLCPAKTLFMLSINVNQNLWSPNKFTSYVVHVLCCYDYVPYNSCPRSSLYQVSSSHASCLHIFETAAETPPMRKSIAKAATPFSAGAFTNTGEAFVVIIDRLSPHACSQSIPLHRKLSSLADKYGPILNFRLGIPRVLVVSSYEAVKDCLNVNDKVFAARPGILAGEYIGYNNAMLFLASYGDYWRKIRKIVINEVLSSSKLEKLRDVRVSEVKTSIKDLYSLFPITGDQNLDFPVTPRNSGYNIDHDFDALLIPKP
ncbi:hypothetical protein BC332_31586 [Capsicum chinense]|nr:hypothetical protein BC332_31586 [Capsicum chinense]